MHDIFVGLMGRRNSEPGESGNSQPVKYSHLLCWLSLTLRFKVFCAFFLNRVPTQTTAPGGESIQRGEAFSSISAGWGECSSHPTQQAGTSRPGVKLTLHPENKWANHIRHSSVSIFLPLKFTRCCKRQFLCHKVNFSCYFHIVSNCCFSMLRLTCFVAGFFRGCRRPDILELLSSSHSDRHITENTNNEVTVWRRRL